MEACIVGSLKAQLHSTYPGAHSAARREYRPIRIIDSDGAFICAHKAQGPDSRGETLLTDIDMVCTLWSEPIIQTTQTQLNAMTGQAERARQNVSDLKTRLKEAEATLKRIEDDCPHNREQGWGPVVSDPIYEKAYRIPGDPPGVGGVDHQFPLDVPAKTTPRWTQTCTLCGKVRTTTQSKPSGQTVPVFH